MNIFISCVSKKKNIPSKAEDLYISELFKKSLNYAKTLNGHIRILSAKYGVLELEDEVSPYNLTLNEMSEKEKKEWSIKVFNQLKKKNIDFNEETIFLVGENYRKYLLKYFSNYKIPIEGLPIGKQLAFYKNHTQNNLQLDYQKINLW